MGNVPLGYLPNIQNQFLTHQPGLVQSDFPPLSSPFYPNKLRSQLAYLVNKIQTF